MRKKQKKDIECIAAPCNLHLAEIQYDHLTVQTCCLGVFNDEFYPG